jgi:RNA polymerase sigma factor (TIGR02999 family)
MADSPGGSDALFALVYDELRRLAAGQLAGERPGHSLDATALVHEAFLRLRRRGSPPPAFENRGHFFAAAAEAMRRILIDHARSRHADKRGGRANRVTTDADDLAGPQGGTDLLALDEALAKLAAVHPDAATLVDLRYFAGLTIPDAADALGMSPRSADRLWAFAKAWLYRELEDETR